MKRSRFTILFASLALATVASAQTFNSSYSDTRTMAHDLSNAYLTNNEFDVSYSQTAAQGPVFINSLQVVGGSNWSSDIDLNADTGSMRFLGYTDGTYSDYNYQLGTALSGEINTTFEALNFYGKASSSVASGIYDFTLKFIGGGDASATDELGSLDLKVEIVDKIGVTVTANGGVIATPDGTVPIDMKVSNTMADRDFISTTHFISGFFNGSQSLDADFLGNWGDKTIAPGDSRTDGNSVWRRNSASGLGTYTGNLGVIGGLYFGDYLGFRAEPLPTIEVRAVPEPASMIALGIGAIGLMRRRRAR